MAKGFNIRAWLGLDTKDYEKGLSKAKRQTKQFSEGLKTSMRGATSASKGFLDKMTGGAVSGFQEMFKGVKLATKGMGGFKAALIGTGIGALVVALGSLVSYFSQTKAGTDLVSKGMAAFGAVMDAVKSRIAQVGGAIVKLFRGDFKGAAEDAKGAFAGIGDQIADNYNKSKVLSDREKKLKEDQIRWTTRQKELEVEISDFKMKAQDKERYSAKEREKFEKNVQTLIKQRGKEKMQLLDEEIAILKERQAQGDNLYEDDQKLAELEASRIGVQKEINDQLREGVTRLATIRGESEKIAIAAAKEAEERAKATQHTLDLAKALNEIEGGTELDDQFDFVTPLEAYEEKLKELKEAQSKAWSTEEFQEYQRQIEATEEQMKSFKGEVESLQSTNEMTSESFLELGTTIAEAFGISKLSFGEFALSLMNLMPQLIAQLDALSAAQMVKSKKSIAVKKAEAIASGTAEGAKAPWFMSIPIIAGIVGTITAMFSSLPKFEDGGILGGNSFTGDKLLFRGNSGEMILNKQQQGNLFKMINQGGAGGGGEVRFEIKGDKLVGVLNNYNNRSRSYG